MADEHKPGDKPTGWFSRRHPTDHEHKLAVHHYRLTRGKNSRKARVEFRKANPVTPERRGARWDTNLGAFVRSV